MKYRTKPVEIEVFEFWPDKLVMLFTWASKVTKNKDTSLEYVMTDGSIALFINTLEGKMRVSNGDYIICGLKGELYPCKPDVFKQKYELVNKDDEYDEIPF